MQRYIEGIAGEYERLVVTEVAPLQIFYPAEEYHVRYCERNPHQPYCRAFISPELANFRERRRRGAGGVPEARAR